MLRARQTFIEFKDAEESTGECRAQSEGRWIQSGHEEWVDFQPDLRCELLAIWLTLTARPRAPYTYAPTGRRSASFCRNWLTLGVAKECTGHPEDKCGKAGCCVAHHNCRVKKQTRGRRYE
mmetsp:Transcript_90878/g.208058  ORF Transcript_90878/g.208058 Transcript_90878/m.208058 type:complete len:121 (+) Transcript_90878:46-408(+)